MCDQTEVSYLEDDVVWVKIGPIWWPGVVKDLEKDEEGKEILAGLKKKPIAVVKFFQEDNYEFVKNLDQIYHYSCRRKDEFIKKGLDKYRTGAAHMKKFPSDVTTAESLTNGDVNIINDPKFYPEKKESYSEIFGSGKKKSKKDSDATPRPKARSSSVTPYRPITHQRFINKVLHGESDHKVKTLIQCNSSAEDGVARNLYKCHICKFETSRVNVIVAHHRLSHSTNSITWTGSDSKLVRRKPVYKSRKIKSKKLFDSFKEDLSDEEDDFEKKKSPKSKNSKEKPKISENIKKEENLTSPTKRKNKEDTSEVSDSKKPRFTDVLLADWNEDDEEDKKEDFNKDSPKDNLEEVDNKNENVSETVNLVKNSSVNEPSINKKTEKMSCFDFDEEEEGFIGMSNANTYGRKIPRVIPVKDKTELGMDLEIEELFKRKSNEEGEAFQEDVSNENEFDENKIISGVDANESGVEAIETSENDKNKDLKEKTPGKPGRRRRSRASKEEEVKVNPEDSLALRRTRRPGAKKSYLNEVIEKIKDVDEELDNKEKAELKTTEKTSEEVVTKTEPTKVVKEEAGSSSRRKQDFKHHTLDSDREEFVYSDILNSDRKSKTPAEHSEKKKTKGSRRKASDDLTSQIENLLEETKLPTLPGVSENSNEISGKADESKSANTTNFSFDYLPNENVGKRTGKTRTEVKSISRMFSDSIPSSENVSELSGDSQNTLEPVEGKDFTKETNIVDGNQSKTIHVANLKFSQSANNSQKRGSIVLSSVPKSQETSGGQVKVVPVVRQANTSEDCIVLPAGKKFDIKKTNVEDVEQSGSEMAPVSPRPKNIKAIKVKSDSLPSSILTSGKLKGQTIIHQKGGKYVIVTQPPQADRPRTTGKVQSGNKVVIFTNQLGEQKIITTSGLQKTKFKLEGQKIIAATDSNTDKETVSTATGSDVQTQPIIKMVPDGKGGIMKQLTVSPKKLLLGSTKVLVSGSGSTFSPGSSVQKIALSSGKSIARAAGGDFRLIENYKGSGKTVLIQGGANSSSGVVLKTSSALPRQITKVIQSPSTIPALKKKPKILMRASTGQGEYVMQSASGTIEAPAIVVKQKGSDGKFSAQKIVRTELVNQPKVSLSGTGTKTFFLAGQGSNKKGESYIITTNDSVPGKVIRMRQKIKQVDGSTTKAAQKIVHKTPEVYSVSQNSLLLPSQSTPETETPQIVQIQEQPQQPVLQTQVIAMPGPVGADGNQTYVLVSVDENGVVQSMDNSVVTYDAAAPSDQIFVNPTSTNNVILLNSQANEEVTPVFSTSSQDILAEALANTNVLEGSISSEMDSVVPSILLPPSIPSSVVQETSITLQKPIMTPLEMPSSVTPDTSGLEPPPLPPTPTEEDVLMEETEMPTDEVNQEQITQNDKKEKELTPADAIQTYLDSDNFDTPVTESEFQVTDFAKEEENRKIFEEPLEADSKSEENGEPDKKTEFFESEEINESATSGQETYKELPQEEYIIENSQEEQTTNSFQSMPILNDEPDTSDDAQGSEPIGDQHFDVEKSRIESEQFSQLLREQEPPSSTNNEMMIDNNPEEDFQTSKYENYQTPEIENREDDLKSKETQEEITEEPKADEGGQKEKEPITMTGNRESQSLPVIADESNANPYDVDPIYPDVISQKRFQEETEVSSTTDEFANKDIPIN